MSTKHRAFTMVEILVVIAIILALVALVASTLLRAKHSAKADVDVSQLHQLGLAANLYHEQCDAWPQNTADLVATGFIPREICKSPRDVYPEGLSNAWLKASVSGGLVSRSKANITPFPNTYVSFGDVLHGYMSEYDRELSESNSGLFVNLLESKLAGNIGEAIFTGRYQRVLLDGSVVTRSHRRFTGKDKDGKPIKFYSDHTWFFDPSPEWIKALEIQLGSGR